MPYGKSAGPTQCPAEYYKALEGDPGTKVFIREVINAYWESGSFPIDSIPEGPTMALAIKQIGRAAFRKPTLKTPGTKSWAIRSI